MESRSEHYGEQAQNSMSQVAAVIVRCALRLLIPALHTSQLVETLKDLNLEGELIRRATLRAVKVCVVWGVGCGVWGVGGVASVQPHLCCHDLEPSPHNTTPLRSSSSLRWMSCRRWSTNCSCWAARAAASR